MRRARGLLASVRRGERSWLATLRAALGRLGPDGPARASWRRPEESVEPRVRRLVADRLGVDPGDLAADVSLTEDLAADSLDLVELTVGMEEELGVSVPESTMGELRTYGQLVAVAQARTRERRAKEAWLESQQTPPFIWARIRPPDSRSGSLEHAGWLTPYTAETMIDSALRGGPGTRVDVGVPRDVEEPVMAQLRAQLAWLRRRRITVHIRRDRHRAPLAVVV